MKRNHHVKAWEVIDFTCYAPSFSIEDEWNEFLVELEAEFTQQTVNKSKKEFWGQVNFASKKSVKKSTKRTSSVCPCQRRMLLNKAASEQMKVFSLEAKREELLRQLRECELEINSHRNTYNTCCYDAGFPEKMYK